VLSAVSLIGQSCCVYERTVTRNEMSASVVLDALSPVVDGCWSLLMVCRRLKKMIVIYALDAYCGSVHFEGALRCTG